MSVARLIVVHMDSNAAVYRDAIDLALVERDAVRTEKETVAARLKELEDQDRDLTQMVTVLHAHLARMGVSVDVRAEANEVPPATTTTTTAVETTWTTPPEVPGRSDDAVDIVYDPPFPKPPGLSRVSTKTSPYRIALILRSTGEVMSRDELMAEYRRQGWIKENWSDPEGAMTQAIRRAVEYGWAQKRGRNEYVTAEASDDQPVVGDDDEDLIGVQP